MRRIKRIFGIVVLAVAAAFVLVFTADYASVRFGIPGHREQFDDVEVRHFYAIKLKNRKTEYTFDQPQPMECVNSLLPHFGDAPCWYRKRHTVVEVNINSGPFGAWIDTP
jgi:hypothetical protein